MVKHTVDTEDGRERSASFLSNIRLPAGVVGKVAAVMIAVAVEFSIIGAAVREERVAVLIIYVTSVLALCTIAAIVLLTLKSAAAATMEGPDLLKWYKDQGRKGQHRLPSEPAEPRSALGSRTSKKSSTETGGENA